MSSYQKTRRLLKIVEVVIKESKTNLKKLPPAKNGVIQTSNIMVTARIGIKYFHNYKFIKVFTKSLITFVS